MRCMHKKYKIYACQAAKVYNENKEKKKRNDNPLFLRMMNNLQAK